MKDKAFYLWLLLLFITFAVGCTKEQLAGFPSQHKDKQAAGEAADVMDNIPIPIEEGVFNKVYGWLNQHTILYSTNVVQGSNVYAYDLDKGTNRLITKSKSMIVSVDISHSGDYLFIRSSLGPSQSLITITGSDGTVLFTHSLDAFDLTMEWNPFNEQQIFISTFSEDWQEQTFILSLADKKIAEAPEADPFSRWYAKDQLIFLDWIGENTALTANLVVLDLNSGQEKKLVSNIIHLDTFQNVMMTIAASPQNNDEAVYHFYTKNMKELGSFVTPQLTSFSDRLIPYYDYNAEKNTFFFFQPVLNKEMEALNEEFKLYRYDLEGEKQKLILDRLKNEPLKCSRDGNFCLYGYNFEKLIDLNKKKVIKLTS